MKAINFQDMVAISTGAASVMGLLFAENFSELGGNVVMCNVNEEILAERVTAVNAKGSSYGMDYSTSKARGISMPKIVFTKCVGAIFP